MIIKIPEQTSNANLWKGEFGNDYVHRNPVNDENIGARMKLLNAMMYTTLMHTGDIFETILEVGCGNGANLLALERLYEVAAQLGSAGCKFNGVEPNEQARKQNESNAVILDGVATALPYPDSSMDMVMTSGVLIHVHPDELLKAMQEIYRVSSNYIFCIEYFAPTQEKIDYHGEQAAMWRNDYGSLWLSNFKLNCIGYGFSWKPVSKLDNLTWWILKKVH